MSLFEYEALYRPFNVRFFKMHPQIIDESDEIHIDLFRASLGDDLPYMAISYVWGSPEDQKEIICNGKTLKVTRNIFSALRAIRDGYLVDQPMLLWADAICINQSDIFERNSQIKLMRRIYSGAEEVLGWLGDATQEWELAVDLLDKLFALNAMVKHNTMRTRKQIVNSFRFPEPASLGWKALEFFLDRTFPYRVWIVQEIASTKRCTLLSGTEWNRPWEYFIDSLQGLSRCIEETDLDSSVCGGALAFHGINGIRNMVEKTNERNLINLIELSRESKATDPRDKVFAITSLSTSRCSATIVPDYNLSVAEVYQNTTRLLISEYNNLDILCNVYPSTEIFDSKYFSRSFDCTDYRLPSWVPNWNLPGNSLAVIFKDGNYEAAGFTKSCVHELGNPAILCVEGYVIDTVGKIAEVNPYVNDMHWGESEPYVFRDWLNLSGEATLPTGLDRFAVLMETIIAGRGASAEIPMSDEEHNQSYNEFLEWVRQLYDDDDTFNSLSNERLAELKSTDISRFKIKCSHNSLLRTLIITTDGYMGLAPCTANVRDVICILFGGQMPFILRPEGDEWRLVGAVYIHGMMEGEMLEREGLVAQKFCIH